MGIRLLCPNGHKLNVKSFLAGKRGVCPHCGSKFDIPSDQKETHDSGDELSLPPPAGDFGLPSPAVESRFTAQSHTPSIAELPQPAAAVHSSPAPFAQPSFSQPIAQHFPPALPAAPQPAVRDPISEAPGAVWYIRHPVAGQFGPAPAELFRQWLDEGRITADSLVWREGWPEWQSARGIFPQFAPAAVAMPQSPFEVAPVASGPFGVPDVAPMLPPLKVAGTGGRGRKKNDQTMVIITIVMLILVVVLGIIFVVVLNNTGQPTPVPAPATTPPATTPSDESASVSLGKLHGSV